MALAKAYAKLRGIKLATLSRYIRGDMYFLKDFARGKISITAQKYDEIIVWFESHWPKDKAIPKIKEFN